MSSWLLDAIFGTKYKDYPTDGIAIPCKPSVRLDIEKPVRDAWPRIQQVFRSNGVEAVCTSANDGTHMDGSLHYEGLALDLRHRHISDGERDLIASELRDTLGNDWDVVNEDTHFHVEYDPA